MKKRNALWVAVFLAGRLAFAADAPADFDWQRAKQLHQRELQGEQLSDEDRAYIAKAKQLFAQRQQQQPQQNTGGEQMDWQRAQQLFQKSERGETLSPEDQAFLDKAKALRQRQQGGGTQSGGTRSEPAGPATGGKDSVGLIPLCDLGTQKYKDQDGGLYGGGKNEPPAEHAAAAKKELAKIHPLDAAGKPADDGKVVLLSVGMSNTTMEYSRFKQLADEDAAKSPRLVIVDGAQGGQTPPRWNTAPDNKVWQTVDQRMKDAGVSAQQVQVIWLKQANAHPTEAYPDHVRILQADITTSLNLLKKKFPNLRIAYLSSRIYGGYATTALNPEPYAYEGAFTMRALIQSQIKGAAELNYDAARGEVKAPLLLWGPYLWADGTKPRSDGLTWTRDDLTPRDGTHPSTAGRQKVAELLLKFCKTDPLARGWFLAKP
ncbi:MAG: hypothetical protein NTY53_15245 [Kiritimatiellaeota bacterium]|nr:hypothetical protein [Kiritimatiellota bacterium]